MNVVMPWLSTCMGDNPHSKVSLRTGGKLFMKYLVGIIIMCFAIKTNVEITGHYFILHY